MDGQPAVRVVRPRPLGLTDRIPVFWAGQEPTQDLKQIDGGALYRHLIAASTPTGSKKRKRGHKYQAPKEGAPHEHFLHSAEDQLQQQQPQQPSEAVGPIAIPKVRLVADYDLNQQAAEHHGPMMESGIAAAPYLRHKEHLDMYDDQHAAEYDADDEDMAWLDSINSKNGQSGILAAAIGLYHQVSMRISGSSEQSLGSERQPSQQQSIRLSVDDFERAIELLEKVQFSAVKAWWDEEQSGPSTSAPRVPKIPAMKVLLPRAVALESLSELLPDRKLAALVLDYWLRKRADEGGPLLARLWFEQPWKLVAFAHEIVDDDEDYDEHLPFMAIEPRSKQKKTRRGGQRRKVTDEDALDALYGLRNELETVRTLADQVRKREKLKRQLLLLSQQEWQTRRQLGVPPGKVTKASLGKAAAAGKGVSQHAGPAAGKGSAWGRGGGLGSGVSSSRAAAAAGPGLSSPPGSPRTELNKSLARVALAAAAAASPVEGEKARQTRTSAAAAAAEFELTFAAKRQRLVAASAGAAAAAAGSENKGSAAGAGAEEPGAMEVPKRKQQLAAGTRKVNSGSRQQRQHCVSTEGAATAGDAEGRVQKAGRSAGPSCRLSRALQISDAADYEVDGDDALSDDTDLPSGLVHEDLAAIAAGARQRDRQQPNQHARRKPGQQGDEGKGRPGARAAASVARAAAAAVIAAEDSGDASGASHSLGPIEEVTLQQQGATCSKGRKGIEPAWQKQQQQGLRAGAAGARQRHPQKQQPNKLSSVPPHSRKNGYVEHAAALPAVMGNGLLHEQSVQGTGNPGAVPMRKRRKVTAAAAAASVEGGADALQVLKPLNQLPKQARGQAESYKSSHKSASPATAVSPTPASPKAVAASSGRGGSGPVSAGNKGQGGGSMRRASGTAAAAYRAAEGMQRRQRPVSRELRSLGISLDK